MTTECEPRPVWFVGAAYRRGTEDQTERFVREGIWEHRISSEDRRYLRTSAQVEQMLPGDRIAIKSTCTQKHGHPFDNRGGFVSMMPIKAVGRITRNFGDGRRVRVAWDRGFEPRDWRFYTYQPTVWKVDPARAPKKDRWRKEALIAFAFEGAEQDIERFLQQSQRLRGTRRR